MSDGFSISHIIDYLHRMGVRIAQIDYDKKTLELAFHGNEGHWRIIIGIQQNEKVSKLLIMVPYIDKLTNQKRLECLEALMAVNYRIAIGKFGVDLEDGEIRLEECIPLADHSISFEQFRLALNAIIQTALIYRDLLTHIVHGELSVAETLKQCEEDFFQEEDQAGQIQKEESMVPSFDIPSSENWHSDEAFSDLNVEDVLQEVTRLLRQNPE